MDESARRSLAEYCERRAQEIERETAEALKAPSDGIAEAMAKVKERARTSGASLALREIARWARQSPNEG